ncbi:hypothetical protein CPSG_07719 [Coccidioides posadasii str. Silveira]|uniref:Uncharacterized protein n=1 Tax=Coccidioides posadasii (strain RMSCC 757 / Silveira) TaxID=443226 RepID=E9DDS7_COCPS|nr:hypothetical protein CPSG_07719 [Coccidioides posadasii str. Silveira]
MVADLAIHHKDKGSPVLVQEVGFLGSYKSLVSSLTGYLQAVPSVQAAILVKIEERPFYKWPDFSTSTV